MILLITCKDRNKNTGKTEVLVSHGVIPGEYVTDGCHRDKMVTLPCETLEYFIQHCKAKYDTFYQSWVITDDKIK